MGILGLLLGFALGREKAAHDEGRDARALEDSFRPDLDPNFELLAGRKCRSCKERIIVQKEGMRCHACARPLHVSCAKRHADKCPGRSAIEE